MGVTGAVLLGIVIFFGIVFLTLLLGAFGRRAERDILRRNAQDVLTGEGGMTLPPSQDWRYRDTPA